MNVFPSRVLVSLLIVVSCEAHAATVYIHPSSAWQISSWRYFKGIEEPPSNWRELDFDDSSWTSGKAPFGYGVRGFVRYGTVLADMQERYTSVLLRKHFYVDDLAKTTALKLSVNYGDGFVAWLNGVQIASQNAPATPTAASTATAEHPASAEHRYEVFPVAGAPLRLGRNILAIQVFTRSRDRDSALLDASLIDTRNLAFQRPASASSIQRNARFFQPSAAVDGTQLTFWSSAEGQGDVPVSFTVDLGQVHTIDRMRLHWWGGKLPGLGGGPRDYELHVSEDSQTWKTVASLTDQKGGERTIVFPAIKARHVRLHMTAANAAKGSIGLLDFEVYAAGRAAGRTRIRRPVVVQARDRILAALAWFSARQGAGQQCRVVVGEPARRPRSPVAGRGSRGRVSRIRRQSLFLRAIRAALRRAARRSRKRVAGH